jgi:hypothetical protein
MAGGAMVRSWKINKREVVHQAEGNGLVKDAIWWPAKAAAQYTNPFKFISSEILPEKTVVIMERRLSRKEAKDLAGMTIKKTFVINNKSAEFTVTSLFINSTAGEMEFSHRYHNMPAYLELHKGKKGQAAMINEGTPSIFERKLIQKVYEFGNNGDPKVLKAFRMDLRDKITSPKITFRCDWLPFDIETSVDGSKLSAICYWDSGKQSCATFEPIFIPVKLTTGEKWQTSMTWKLTNKK